MGSMKTIYKLSSLKLIPQLNMINRLNEKNKSIIIIKSMVLKVYEKIFQCKKVPSLIKVMEILENHKIYMIDQFSN